MRNLLTNWKTTSAGISSIGFAVINLIFSKHDALAWTIAFPQVLTGVGLIFAGDAGASAGKDELQKVKDAVRTGDTSLLTKDDLPPPS